MALDLSRSDRFANRTVQARSLFRGSQRIRTAPALSWITSLTSSTGALVGAFRADATTLPARINALIALLPSSVKPTEHSASAPRRIARSLARLTPQTVSAERNIATRSSRGPNAALTTATRALGIALCLTGTSAAALSCAPYSLASALHAVSTSADGYIAVHGTLIFDESRLPVTDWDNQQATPERTLIPARITGQSLARSGFTVPFDRHVTLEILCAGPWCPTVPSGKAALSFLRQTASGYTLSIHACEGDAFFDPTPRMLRQTKRCYVTGHCPEPSF